MELKEKRKKKRKKGTKRTKQIPSFLSHYVFRTSWALKFIASIIKKSSNKFSDQFMQEIMLTAQNVGESVKIKTEIQKQALKKQFFFKYYRW